MSLKTTGEAGPGRSPLVFAIVLLALAAGCGGGSEDGGQEASKVPACANAGKAIDRPAEVPADLLPRETVLTSSERRPDGELLVSGVIPREFRKAVEFFVNELPAAGYRNGEGDAEQDEAESRFSGKGITGKWKVNGILNCPDAVTLSLLVSR